MVRVLVTGGSGFLAGHVLDQLLERGHSVVTTVRSQEKADNIKKAHPNRGKDELDVVFVEDIGKEHAFDKAVVSDPPFEAVIHTASPFHYNVSDVQKELYEPALVGTTGILKSIKAHAPSVKRVVITSSFAAVLSVEHGAWPEHTYSEADWNPMTAEDGLQNPQSGYRASKTIAERAAWDFVKNENPNFTLATINPPLIFGPVVKSLQSLGAINTSNEKISNFIQGKFRSEIPDTGTYSWVDVRDTAMAHVKAVEVSGAAGLRFLTIAGNHSNRELIEVLRRNFPEYDGKLPGLDLKGGDYPEGGVYGFNNSQTTKTLGIKFRSFEEAVVDTVKSLKGIPA